MVDFWVYDVIFMIIFTLLVIWFIKSRKDNLSREGIIFMYRTQLGVKAINWVGDNFKKTLLSLRYVIITVGLFLMSIMIWMLGQTLWIYISRPEITQIIKAPPIAPLIPYFPKIFGLESIFPPFYFTYFIVALAIVAFVHEFSHGIYMRLFKTKIKSTGLIFLGPILGAFVEEERKSFFKKKNGEQMTILAAGVFANLVFAIIFYGLYVLFFFSTFTPSGYNFNTYALEIIPTNSINTTSEEGNFTLLTSGGRTYYLDDLLKRQLENGGDQIIVYSDAPAVKARMRGAIIEANGIKINNYDDLRKFLEDVEPGDSAKFVTDDDGKINEYDIVLTEHPDNPDKAFVGIGNRVVQPRGIVQNLLVKFMSFRDINTYYKPKINADVVFFIFHLLWWIMIINFLVAIFNMLPLGMLDGGRFFYLAVLSVTKSESIAKNISKYATYGIAFIFFLLMVIWAFRIYF